MGGDRAMLNDSKPLETSYPGIAGTDLCQIFKEKAADNAAFISAVNAVCYHGITISKQITRFFPNFTLHDETHILNVCNWMTVLLGERKKDLTDKEAALLVMSACCHDIGMAVSDTQKADFLEEGMYGEAVKDYLENAPRVFDAYVAANETVTDELLRYYVRSHHHDLVGQHIPYDQWPSALVSQGIARETLLDVCRSHGEALNAFERESNETIDFGLCIVLLRLADILDFDSTRAPATLFEHLNLANAETFEDRVSQAEWKKNASGGFALGERSTLRFNARFESLPLEMEVRTYIDWVKHELEGCNEYLRKRGTDRWKKLSLPHTVVLAEVDRRGYHFGDFQLSMDQDRVLELLSGENLYADAGVFVRELLQNAIDAILHRHELDPNFRLSEGLISVYSWTDEEGYDWFRIEDNGTGMDEDIIQKYFLKVGRSYYGSEDYRIALLKKNGRDADRVHTPISRFGIGILSCFMGDKVNNRLEVSTKRYGENGKREPGIRLNVDGLHGYYYMARQDDKDGELLKTLHNPQNKKEGFRTKVGTTICVRCHTYQLGNYASLKDILDKYVSFPEVRVEYHGPDSVFHKYPTQQELMDWAHSMNPDGRGKTFKQYEWQVPDEYLKFFPDGYEVKWEEPPTIVGEVVPLDWCTHNPDVSGVAVRISPKESSEKGTVFFGNASTSFKWNLYGGFSNIDFDIRIEDERIEALDRKIWEIRYDSNPLWREFPVDQYPYTEWESFVSALDNYLPYHSYSEKKIQQWKQKIREAVRPYADVLPFWRCHRRCSISFHTLNEFLNNGVPFLPGWLKSTNVCAHNGVLAGSGSVLIGAGLGGTYLLLRGSERPDLDVSRGNIRHLPITVACALAEIVHNVSFLEGSSNNTRAYGDYPVSGWMDILRKHDWMRKISVPITINGTEELVMIEDLLSRITKSPDTLTYSLLSFTEDMPDLDRLTLDRLALSVLCSGKMVFQYEDGSSLDLLKSVIHENVSFFPPGLFALPQNDEQQWRGIVVWGFARYNFQHPLSQWLLDNAKELSEELPDLFHRIVHAMACFENEADIVTAVTACLQQIKRYNENRFQVTDELFVTEKDFR